MAIFSVTGPCTAQFLQSLKGPTTQCTDYRKEPGLLLHRAAGRLMLTTAPLPNI